MDACSKLEYEINRHYTRLLVQESPDCGDDSEFSEERVNKHFV